MEEKWLVGVDIGGTTIKLAFISEVGEIIAKWEIETNKSDNGQHIPAEISKSIHQMLKGLGHSKDSLLAIGVGAPGPINFQDGSIR
ncbi:ROK family protein [Alkalihalobacillus sp. BA299]|uniref:ROK family protein n=1 Tax=Alkalihalobacillus sp. BA299 TaxID=2815938 RepID=UPI001ADBF61B|nr:ROK family protein [Alkalihalobacillus sp. BA299]